MTFHVYRLMTQIDLLDGTEWDEPMPRHPRKTGEGGPNGTFGLNSSDHPAAAIPILTSVSTLLP
jgi:hypothetical protein